MPVPPILDSHLRKISRRHRIPGLAFLLSSRGRPVISQGYGYRDVARRLPVTAKTVFGIASVTKSFTAVAVLRLQESGALRLSDRVTKHLPEFSTPSRPWTTRIQLHHFLTHTSGLPPLPSVYYSSARSLARHPPYVPRTARRVGVDPGHTPLDTYEQVLEYLRTARYRLLGPPGATFSYSNEAFGLLGAVIERVSGRALEEYVEAEILRPVGMTRTTFDTGRMLRSPEVTTLYSPDWTHRKRGWIASQDWWEDSSLRACGGLRTNLDDLARYLEIFRSGGRAGRERILSRDSVAAMTKPHAPIYPGFSYGYGLFVWPDFPGGPLVGHGGDLPGVSSQFLVHARKGVVSAALANADQVPSATVARAGLNFGLGRRLEAPLVDFPRRGPRPGDLSEYTGWYCSGEGIWFRARPSRGRLRLDFSGIEFTSQDLRFRPNGGDEFVRGRRGQNGYLRFEREPRGRIWAAFFGLRLIRRRTPNELPLARKGHLVW